MISKTEIDEMFSKKKQLLFETEIFEVFRK